MLNEVKDSAISAAYNKLFHLFSYCQLEEIAAEGLAAGILKPEHFLAIQDLKEGVYTALKNDALVLAEGLQFTDKLLLSAIAMDDGKPYEHLYEWAKNHARLNRAPNGIHQVLMKNWIPFADQRESVLTAEERLARDKL